MGQPEAYQLSRDILDYQDVGSIRGSTSDEPSATFSGTVLIGYAEGRKDIAEELIKRRNQIRNEIRIKISQMTKDQLRPDQQKVVQDELKTLVNSLLSVGQVREVLLDDFVVL